MTKAERLEKQRQRLAEMKIPEVELRKKGYKFIAGVDEVGRGPLAGPVVAAAVVLPDDFSVLGIDDSKKLSEKKREELFIQIKENAVAWGIGMADHEVIDDINILQATKLAMKRAINDLNCKLAKMSEPALSGTEQQMKDIASVTTTAEMEMGEPLDVTAQEPHSVDYILFDAVKIEDLETPQEAIIKGDAKVLAIAAASIIAKVTRDRMMVKYSEIYPGYAFERNKGYGTKAHYEGLRENGICPIHRRTFLKNFEG